MRHRCLPVMGFALLMALSLARTSAVADVTLPLSLTCPQPITVGNDLNACSAFVTYPAPTPTGGNGDVTVSCVPPSGSIFPVGATTVHCKAMDRGGQTATCQFTVTVQDVQAPSCSLCFFSVITHDCTNSLTLVATSRAGAPFPFGTVAFAPGVTDNCPNVQSDVTRGDGLGLGDLYPVGDTLLTEVSTDAAGNSNQCTATVSVLPSFVRLASQVYVHYQVPAPGDTVIDLLGSAELRLDVSYPTIPPSPVRLHTLINLHDVVATWNGVQYHATNNLEADLTSNQLSPLSLTVPGVYKFEAHGKAAVHSFSLSLPLQAAITGGALTSAVFGPPQFMLAEPSGA